MPNAFMGSGNPNNNDAIEAASMRDKPAPQVAPPARQGATMTQTQFAGLKPEHHAPAIGLLTNHLVQSGVPPKEAQAKAQAFLKSHGYIQSPSEKPDRSR